MRISTKARAAGLVTAGVVAGGVLAGTLSANAASRTSSGSTSSGTATTPSYGAPAMPGGRQGHGPGPGGASPMRSDEKLVTGSDAATLRAEALKAVPGGTVVRIETDAGDAAYEAHMTKPDGSVVTVKFDKNLKVTGVENCMGKGDPAPAGAPSHP